MIRISNLIFEYTNGEEKNRVLNCIDLTIREGESIGLMGPNGSGKTTLARCLNGLLLPTEGEVLVEGMNTNESAKISQIRRLVGMVFQNPENQIVSTTVEREIAFGLENLGVDYEQMHQTVDKMLEQFDLQKYRNHPPHLLSSPKHSKSLRLLALPITTMQPGGTVTATLTCARQCSALLLMSLSKMAISFSAPGNRSF